MFSSIYSRISDSIGSIKNKVGSVLFTSSDPSNNYKVNDNKHENENGDANTNTVDASKTKQKNEETVLFTSTAGLNNNNVDESNNIANPHENAVGGGKSSQRRYATPVCNNKMTFDECELAILRQAVDEGEARQGRLRAKNEEIKHIIAIVEAFIGKQKLICYGGTAINNILPVYDQFYNRDVEIPDYDFYSANALADAKRLTDIYVKEGYIEVEAKSGMHYGTFKVFVNFVPVADITQTPLPLFNAIKREAISIDGILYSPPNLLRMNAYAELSRPAGNISRWEKVMTRLNLLNKHYPLTAPVNCLGVDFQRSVDPRNSAMGEKSYVVLRDTFIQQEVVFFGGYANSLYSRYMEKNERNIVKKIPDFDVISENRHRCASIAKMALERSGMDNVSLIAHDAIADIIPAATELRVGEETLAFIYDPIGCHSYNEMTIHGKHVRVATIDTMLSFYLAFFTSNAPHVNKERIMCMAKFLFEVEQKNRLSQKGLLKRFSMECIGKQPSMEDIRAEKVSKFRALRKKRGTYEYEMWFLKYRPTDEKKSMLSTNATSKRSSIEEDIDNDAMETSIMEEKDDNEMDNNDDNNTKKPRRRVGKKKGKSVKRNRTVVVVATTKQRKQRRPNKLRGTTTKRKMPK